MILLLTLIASLVVFEVDIVHRYGAGESVALYQSLTALLVAVNALLFLPTARWGRRWAAAFGEGHPRPPKSASPPSASPPSASSHPASPPSASLPSASSHRGNWAWAVSVAVLLVGAAILYQGAGRGLVHVFRNPVDVTLPTAPTALAREAAQRIQDGISIYSMPYDMGGWEARLNLMPWTVRWHGVVESLGFDGRFSGLVSLGLLGALGVVLAVGLAERWRRRRAGGLALAGAVLVLVAVGLLVLGLPSRTFVVREPIPVVWLAVALAGWAASARRWNWAALGLAVAAGFSIPMLFVGIVFLFGAAGWMRGETRAGRPVPGFPGEALAIYVAVLILALGPHVAELGAWARSVLEEPFGNARYLAEVDALGTLPGLAHLLDMANLRGLIPVVFLIFLGEMCNRAYRATTIDALELPRILVRVLFVQALLAPIPSNKDYWPFLAMLLVVAALQVREETCASEESETGTDTAFASVAPAEAPAPPAAAAAPVRPASFRSPWPVAAGIVCVAVVFGALAARLAFDPPGRPLDRQDWETQWKGLPLAYSGFHPIEGDQQRWMNGPRSIINLSTTKPRNGTLRLQLSVVGSNTRPSNGLTVELNGHTLYSTVLGTGTLNFVEFPVYGDFMVVGPNTLVLLADWADSPAAMGLEGNDTRTLAFGYYGLQWQPE